jgi:formylglycine-generating enzyme required for sulfatase activity
MNAGEEREVDFIRLCWCPPGRFVMGSPRTEAERRPGEDPVAVTLTKGFWAAKYEATQGHWKRVIGTLPGPLTWGWPCRSACRVRFEPERRYDHIGFRVVAIQP